MNSPKLGANHTQSRDDDETADEPCDGANPGVLSKWDEDLPTSVVLGIASAVLIGAVLWIGVLTIVALLL